MEKANRIAHLVLRVIIIALIVLILLTIGVVVPVIGIVELVLIVLFILYKIFEGVYYSSGNFKSLKRRIGAYVDDCNALNAHIEGLKDAHFGIDQTDWGRSSFKERVTSTTSAPSSRARRRQPTSTTVRGPSAATRQNSR